LKPSWIKVELFGCAGIPPFGEIILGKVVGIVVAVVDAPVELPSPGPLEGVAAAILDSTDSDLAVSVPVGLMLWGGVEERSEDVTAGMTLSGSEVWDVGLAIAGVMLGGAVLFPVEGVSVEVGTTGASVLEVGMVVWPTDADVSETLVGPVVGPLVGPGSEVVLTLGAGEGTKDEMLETTVGTRLSVGVTLGAAGAEKEVTESAADVAWPTAELPAEVAWLTTESAADVAWPTAELPAEVPWLTTESAVDVAWLTAELPAEVAWLTAELATEVAALTTELPAEVTELTRPGSLVVVAVVAAAGSVLVAVFVPVLGSVFVFVPVLAAVLASEESVVGVPVVVGDCPADVVVVVSAPADTETAPPTTTVFVPASVAVEVDAVVLRKGPTCLLISLGK
jgi:hypothetical protein